MPGGTFGDPNLFDLHSTNRPGFSRLLTSSADGYVRSYKVIEKSHSNKLEQDLLLLDASALSLELEEVRLMSSKSKYSKSLDDSGMVSLGSVSLSVVRNYVGEDKNAGDEVSAALRLDGHVAIWRTEQQQQPPHFEIKSKNLSSVSDQRGRSSEPKTDCPFSIVRPHVEFFVKGSTGTTMLMLSPQLTGYSKHGIVMMIGMLDGSVSFICTGVAIPDSKNCNEVSQCSEKGTVLGNVGSGNSIPLSIATHPFHYLIFAVGRKDGTVDMYSSRSWNSHDDIYGNFHRIHRLLHHAGSPVRALAFTPDGSLLISGCDGGHLYIYDTSSLLQNETIRLVAAIQNAHKGYILSISVLPDGKRFLTSSADTTVKVWDVGTPNSGPVHTFDGGHDSMVWDVSCSLDGNRCASCSDDGYLQIYSCQE